VPVPVLKLLVLVLGVLQHMQREPTSMMQTQAVTWIWTAQQQLLLLLLLQSLRRTAHQQMCQQLLQLLREHSSHHHQQQQQRRRQGQHEVYGG
jgi:hypothetical protein